MDANTDLMYRYQNSKLIQAVGSKQLAAAVDASGKGHVLVNSLNPGLSRTQLTRHVSFPINIIVFLLMWVLGRSAEAGSRCLVAAAQAGEDTHGRFTNLCTLEEDPPLMLGEEGAAMQKKIWGELLDVLDEIEPGVVDNI